MQFFQRTRVPEVRQVKGLAEILREDSPAIEPERSGRRGQKQLRQLDSEQAANPGLKRRRTVACCSRRNAT